MAFAKGKIEPKSEKEIKNKKLKEIRESNIDISIHKTKEYTEIEITIDSVLKPAPRPNVTSIYKNNKDGSKELQGFRMYDPLSAYKDYLKKKFSELKYDLPELPFKGEVQVELYIDKVPSPSWSNKDKYYAIKGYKKMLMKPDVDNTEKTLFDCLTGILYEDDAQITKNKTEKRYYYADRTYAKFRLMKPDERLKSKKRLTKEENSEWKEIEKKLIYK